MYTFIKHNMGKLINVITPLHKTTKRDYIQRMDNQKAACAKIAKKYGFDYWDGDRRYGYGGYKYDGRWKIVAQKLISLYMLRKTARILDVGCGKAHLLYELMRLLPESKVVGFDISKYGIAHAPKEVKPYLKVRQAQDKYAYPDKYFDLVISINTLHNLKINDLKKALSEIERTGKRKFILVESYRNEQELFNLQCWALTCVSFFDKDSWIWLFRQFGYSGDYEFIFFE